MDEWCNLCVGSLGFFFSVLDLHLPFADNRLRTIGIPLSYPPHDITVLRGYSVHCYTRFGLSGTGGTVGASGLMIEFSVSVMHGRHVARDRHCTVRMGALVLGGFHCRRVLT